VDSPHYRPGTVSGDALLAHEVTHVVQQRGNDADSTPEALELEADRAAVAMVTNHPGRFLPQMRSALSLQRCTGSTSAENEALQRLRNESDPGRLADALRPATDEQLGRLAQAVAADTVQGQAVAWERAIRAGDYRHIGQLLDRSRDGFRQAYAPRISEAIMEGRTTIRVDGDNALRAHVRGAFTDLLQIASGFRLVVLLLATGQPVTIKRAQTGQGHQTVRVSPEGRLRTQVTDEKDPLIGTALPLAKQARGAGSGSTITLDLSTAGNEVTLGGTKAAPAIIAADPRVNFGHELIHALHAAMGENIGSGIPPLVSGVRDPVTDRPVNPEEPRTITGQTRFSPLSTPTPEQPASFPAEFNLSGGITENDLRRDLGLPPRIAHVGARDTIRIRRSPTATVDALVNRYRVKGAPLPPEARRMPVCGYQNRWGDAPRRRRATGHRPVLGNEAAAHAGDSRVTTSVTRQARWKADGP
jgi:hypothetical protein